VLSLYPRLSNDLRGRAQTLLCGRPGPALALLQAVDAGKISPREVPLDQLRRITEFKSAPHDRLVEKHWGRIGPATAGEKQTQIRHIATVLRQGVGDPVNGRLLFQKHCGTCHPLFGEGTKIGPDLTGADRKNLDWLLTNIVDPSALIRAEYAASVVVLTDGRSLIGLIAEATPQAITLVDARNERTVLAREKIEEIQTSRVSLMPEKILDPLKNQELRDLFSYLQGDAPAGAVPKKGPGSGRAEARTRLMAHDGHLFFTANQLHRQAGFHRGQDLRQKPYGLFRTPIDAGPVLLR
jgi:putative heme-binding domain-containing protein